MRCGRQPGGENAGDNPCPASIEKKLDGVHGGRNAGRACWIVAGTFCKGKPTGTFADKLEDCLICPFMKLVREEEGGDLKRSVVLEDLLCRTDE
jgi:hypothetical protein